MPDQPQRLIYLESIRGLAALAVVVGHLAMAFYPQMWEAPAAPPAPDPLPYALRVAATPPLNVAYNGRFAVVVFFVLSGFVLSYAFFRSDPRDPASRGDGLASAAVRRYLRLVIPILSSVAVAYALHAAGLFYNRPAAAVRDAAGPAPGAWHWWLGSFWDFAPSARAALKEGVFNVFFRYREARTYNAVLWTMQYELAGSFLVYTFLALFGRLRNRWAVYLVLGLVLHRLRHPYLLDFLLGVCLSDGLASLAYRGATPRGGAWAAVIAIVGLCLGARWSGWLPPGSAGPLWGSTGAVLVIAGVALSPQAQALLGRPTFVWLGKASFAIYLLHLIVLCSAGAWVYVTCRAAGWGHGAASGAAAAMTVVITLIASGAAYRLVDVPAISLGRTVYTRFFQPR